MYSVEITKIVCEDRLEWGAYDDDIDLYVWADDQREQVIAHHPSMVEDSVWPIGLSFSFKEKLRIRLKETDTGVDFATVSITAQTAKNGASGWLTCRPAGKRRTDARYRVHYSDLRSKTPAQSAARAPGAAASTLSVVDTLDVPRGYALTEIDAAVFALGSTRLGATTEALPRLTVGRRSVALAQPVAAPIIEDPANTLNQKARAHRGAVTGRIALVPVDGLTEGSHVAAVQCRAEDAALVCVSGLCERTPDAMARWQAEVYRALMAGHATQREAWARADAGRAYVGGAGRIEGGHAREIEAAELKRGALELLVGGPPPRAPVAVQFLEQAFEWDRLQHEYYPYVWGSDAEQMLLDDPDPAHAAFLRAGAARLLVPIAPGFEADVAAWLTSQTLWSSTQGAAPNILHPKHRWWIKGMGPADHAPKKTGTVWTSTLPTALVLLDGSTLPSMP